MPTLPTIRLEQDARPLVGAELAEALETLLPRLLTLPSAKQPEQNDWGDEDSLEVDLEQPLTLEGVKIELELYAPSMLAEVLLSRGHTLSISVQGERFALRPLACRFSDMISARLPRQALGLEAVLLPPNNLDASRANASPFTEGWLIPLAESEALLMRPLPIKAGITTPQGRYLGGSRILRASQSLELPCLLVGHSIEELLQRRSQLLGYLISPGIKELTLEEETIRYYYKSCNSGELTISPRKIYWELTLSLIQL